MSVKATIYQPAKGAMQSGRGKAKAWRLEYDLSAGRGVEPLMGWTSATDMRQELSLSFASQEEAVAFCERNQIDYRVRQPQQRRVRIRAYADNFGPGTVRGPGTEPI
ncbi:MAG: ETC complex I subunit [Alphaproteobacteria bacterium]|nr:ETC complex I subunit [Alphaproteobacteria bacterium]MDP6831449.1 ETC complex I subunit [Alphaproteobacteria bacterium]MDP6876678.1 ETC complex I subunit [Alphaproteobacteria bacterium]